MLEHDGIVAEKFRRGQRRPIGADAHREEHIVAAFKEHPRCVGAGRGFVHAFNENRQFAARGAVEGGVVRGRHEHSCAIRPENGGAHAVAMIRHDLVRGVGQLEGNRHLPGRGDGGSRDLDRGPVGGRYVFEHHLGSGVGRQRDSFAVEDGAGERVCGGRPDSV